MLYNSNMAAMLIGCLLKNTTLLTNPNYPLSKFDFSTEIMHRILYVCALNIAKAGCNDISEIEIDNYISKYEEQKEILEDNNWTEFIYTVKELSNLNNFDAYYTAVRKYALLREIKEQGFDIKPFYDETKDEYEAQQELDKWTIQDILDYIEAKTTHFRNAYDINYVKSEIYGGQDTQALIDKFKVRPAFGAGLQSGYLTAIWNGWCQGHLLLRGGASGVGKSSTFIGDLCSVGQKELWDNEVQDFVPNLNYQSPTVYIHTEMDSEEEIQPKFLACISGVDVSKITQGLMSREEELRVLKAGEIMQSSLTRIVYMPDFTCQTIERKLQECVKENGIKYAVFDYLELQGALSAEFKTTTNLPPREDIVLKNAATRLKEFAEELNIGIMTGCQLNDSWKEKSFIDESCLSGSKAMKNKLDGGSIIVPSVYLRKDMKILESQFSRKGFGSNCVPMPNTCETIFKSRFGKYGSQRLKLYSYIDHATCRRYDYGVWDDLNRRVGITPIKVEEEDF